MVSGMCSGFPVFGRVGGQGEIVIVDALLLDWGVDLIRKFIAGRCYVMHLALQIVDSVSAPTIPYTPYSTRMSPEITHTHKHKLYNGGFNTRC